MFSILNICREVVQDENVDTLDLSKSIQSSICYHMNKYLSIMQNMSVSVLV
jgi:hypothetical protein